LLREAEGLDDSGREGFAVKRADSKGSRFAVCALSKALRYRCRRSTSGVAMSGTVMYVRKKNRLHGKLEGPIRSRPAVCSSWNSEPRMLTNTRDVDLRRRMIESFLCRINRANETVVTTSDREKNAATPASASPA
jgi:hypothetical protein